MENTFNSAFLAEFDRICVRLEEPLCCLRRFILLAMFSQEGEKVEKEEMLADIQIIEQNFDYMHINRFFTCHCSTVHLSQLEFIIKLYMQSSADRIQSNDDVLRRLNQLNDTMQSQPAISEELLRSYVDSYVRRHSLSQDFFSALCQHCILHKLFGPQARHIPSVSLLEIFNLLLANTSQQNNLVFMFSQTALHQYLFERFNPFTQSIEAVEYYVQLLKTIILKISHGNSSLIKLFCNNRYSSFPLLSIAVTLASAYNKEELVKVTASQCVLQLIAIINEKRVGKGYLTDLQMVIFYYQLSCRLRQQADQEGNLKYVVDLLYALRDNPTSMSFLFSAITNNVILPSLHSLPAILKLLRRLSQLIQQHGDFPKEKYRHLRRVLHNILATFYFAKFTNSTYMAALKLLSHNNLDQPNLFKYYQKRGEKVAQFLLEFDTRKESQEDEEKYLLYESWANFNHCSEEIQKIKQGKLKTKNSIFSNLFSKPDPQQQYIRKAMTSVGLNYEELRFPLFKLSVTLNMKTAIFLVEQALTKRQERGEVIPREQLEAHLSDFRGKFELSQEMCVQILLMVNKLNRFGLSMTIQNKDCPAQVEFQYRFLLKFRSYLLNTLSDFLLVIDKELSLRAIAVIRETITRLGVFPLLDLKIRKKIVWKLQEVQHQIHQLNFKNDFRALIGYIINNKEEEFMQIFDQDNRPTHPQHSTTEIKVFQYEFLRTIIDPSLQSIGEFVNREWYQAMTKQKVALRLSFPYGLTGTITLKPTNFGIVLELKANEGDKVQGIKIKEDDPKVNAKDPCTLQFKELVYQLTMRNQDDANSLRGSIESIRLFREERITMLIVQYFESTYIKIGDKFLKRNR